MAKGQLHSNKEAKKPKADKNQAKTHLSAYKQSQLHTAPTSMPPPPAPVKKG